MPGVALRHSVLMTGPRARFVRDVMGLGRDVRLLWLPKPGDAAATKTIETVTGQVVTWDATVAGRLSALGNGVAQSFVSASTQYGSAPDTTSLTFGTGVADTPFSVVALANITNTAAYRTCVGKWVSGQEEWLLAVDPTDLLALLLGDISAAISIQRGSDAAITMGSWRLFGASYDGTGGATAANGITLYQDGAVIASTATNNAGYVAMENGTSDIEFGAFFAHTQGLLDGSLALLLVVARALTTVEHRALAIMCNRYFGLGL